MSERDFPWTHAGSTQPAGWALHRKIVRVLTIRKRPRRDAGRDRVIHAGALGQTVRDLGPQRRARTARAGDVERCCEPARCARLRPVEALRITLLAMLVLALAVPAPASAARVKR